MTRKFRFDWAIPSEKIAIEYEGLFGKMCQFCKMTKSGHLTVQGYDKDCIKYNLAAIEGWRVLRYTAKNYTNIKSDILNLWQKKLK